MLDIVQQIFLYFSYYQINNRTLRTLSANSLGLYKLRNFETLMNKLQQIEKNKCISFGKFTCMFLFNLISNFNFKLYQKVKKIIK